jgi:putative MATE family efflux protein
MRAMQARYDVTSGSLARAIWKLALPTMITSALFDVFNLVDMIFVGRLGPSAIAAVSMSGILMGIIRMIAMGISTGTMALVSRFTGSGDEASAEKVLGQSITLSIISAGFVAVLGGLFAEPVLRVMGAAEDVVPQGAAYFRIMCLGSITMYFTIALGAGMRGFGDAVTPMWALGISSLLNIGLDPLFIFGVGAFPRLEVAGSAVATVISRGVGSLILLYVLVSGSRGIRATGFLPWRGQRYLGRIVRIGSFSTLRMLGMNLSRLVLVRIVAIFGTFALAAFGIGMRIRILVLVLGFGLGNATAVVVGQNLGAGKPDRAEKGAWLSLGYYSIFLAVVSALFLAMPRSIISIFNTHPEVLRLGTTFLYFFVPSIFFLGFSVIMHRAIDGAGDTMATMIISLLAQIGLGIPMAWFFSRWWDINGVWAALVGSNMLSGLGMLIYFRLGRWKKKKV